MEREVDQRASVVAIEGTLDALAIAAAAARAGALDHFAPVSQSGVSMTYEVAERVGAIAGRPPIACGDTDPAGVAASARWASRIMRHQHREVLAVALPLGMDPASYLEEEGPAGLAAFSSWRCLEDQGRLRPRPAGGVIAAAALRTAMTEHPDAPIHTLAAPTVETVSKIAAPVPGAGTAERFAKEAAERIVAVVDGRPANWYVDKIQERAAELSGRPPPLPPLPQRPHGRVLGD